MGFNPSMESTVEGHLYAAKNCIMKWQTLSTKAFFYSDQGIFVNDPFDLSDRGGTKKTIQALIKKNKANMVVLAYESWVTNQIGTFPSLAPDRRQAICIYGETIDDAMTMVQEYEIDKSGKVIFGKSAKLRKVYPGALTGFFKL